MKFFSLITFLVILIICGCAKNIEYQFMLEGLDAQITDLIYSSVQGKEVKLKIRLTDTNSKNNSIFFNNYNKYIDDVSLVIESRNGVQKKIPIDIKTMCCSLKIDKEMSDFITGYLVLNFKKNVDAYGVKSECYSKPFIIELPTNESEISSKNWLFVNAGTQNILIVSNHPTFSVKNPPIFFIDFSMEKNLEIAQAKLYIENIEKTQFQRNEFKLIKIDSNINLNYTFSDSIEINKLNQLLSQNIGTQLLLYFEADYKDNKKNVKGNLYSKPIKLNIQYDESLDQTFRVPVRDGEIVFHSVMQSEVVTSIGNTSSKKTTKVRRIGLELTSKLVTPKGDILFNLGKFKKEDWKNFTYRFQHEILENIEQGVEKLPMKNKYRYLLLFQGFADSRYLINYKLNNIESFYGEKHFYFNQRDSNKYIFTENYVKSYKNNDVINNEELPYLRAITIKQEFYKLVPFYSDLKKISGFGLINGIVEKTENDKYLTVQLFLAEISENDFSELKNFLTLP